MVNLIVVVSELSSMWTGWGCIPTVHVRKAVCVHTWKLFRALRIITSSNQSGRNLPELIERVGTKIDTSICSRQSRWRFSIVDKFNWQTLSLVSRISVSIFVSRWKSGSICFERLKPLTGTRRLTESTWELYC